MKLFKRTSAFLLSALMVVTSSGCTSKSQGTTAENTPTVGITIWNYYNGDQQIAFEEMVDRFNEGEGREKGIVVEVVGQGSIDGLASELMDAINGKVGVQSMPNMVSIYADIAYELIGRDVLVDIDKYFTKEELSEYKESFLNEGRVGAEDQLLNFPVTKSSELFVYNKTDWEPFEKACGVKVEDIKTFEDLTAAAKTYYEWTDSLTPEVMNDGKGLFSRDALDNYIVLGSAELGHPVFSYEKGEAMVDLDYDTFKKLWDNYYIPTIEGYFGPCVKYSSEDAKTGQALAVVCSSTGISYFPRAVTNEQDESHDIEAAVLPVMHFEGTKTPLVAQQGAGYSILKSTESQEKACTEFLKWFTQEEQNLQFSVDSGYLPVKTDTMKKEKIEGVYATLPEEEQKALSLDLQGLVKASEMLNENTAYAAKAFKNSMYIRSALKDALRETAKADRIKVDEKIASGISKEEAVAEFKSEEYFKVWFDGLKKTIDEINANEKQ